GGGPGLVVAELFRAVGRPCELPANRPGQAAALAEGAARETAAGDGRDCGPARPSSQYLSPGSRTSPLPGGGARQKPRWYSNPRRQCPGATDGLRWNPGPADGGHRGRETPRPFVVFYLRG